MDISKLSYSELLKLRNEIDRVIDGRREEERAATLEKIQNLANEAGFEIDDLFGAKKVIKKISTSDLRAQRQKKQKYANPANPNQTWTGRGNTPGWAREYISNGGNKSDLLIQKE